MAFAKFAALYEGGNEGVASWLKNYTRDIVGKSNADKWAGIAHIIIFQLWLKINLKVIANNNVNGPGFTEMARTENMSLAWPKDGVPFPTEEAKKWQTIVVLLHHNNSPNLLFLTANHYTYLNLKANVGEETTFRAYRGGLLTDPWISCRIYNDVKSILPTDVAHTQIPPFSSSKAGSGKRKRANGTNELMHPQRKSARLKARKGEEARNSEEKEANVKRLANDAVIISYPEKSRLSKKVNACFKQIKKKTVKKAAAITTISNDFDEYSNRKNQELVSPLKNRIGREVEEDVESGAPDTGIKGNELKFAKKMKAMQDLAPPKDEDAAMDTIFECLHQCFHQESKADLRLSCLAQMSVYIAFCARIGSCPFISSMIERTWNSSGSDQMPSLIFPEGVECVIAYHGTLSTDVGTDDIDVPRDEKCISRLAVVAFVLFTKPLSAPTVLAQHVNPDYQPCEDSILSHLRKLALHSIDHDKNLTILYPGDSEKVLMTKCT